MSYYWQSHQRHFANGRLAWYAEPADADFWYRHWQAKLQQGYLRDAASCDLLHDEMGRVLLRELPRDGVHLEAGCGAGYWVAALRQAGYCVEGIEYAADLVALVNAACPELPVRAGNVLSIDRPDSYYDSYISFGVVEHRFEGPEPFLAEALRVLKPRGKLIITVPHVGRLRRWRATRHQFEDQPPSRPFFQYAFPPDEFTGLVAGAGFHVTAVRPMFIHRLLLEEVAAYRWLMQQRGARIVKQTVRRLLHGRDGHMLLVLAHKPEAA